MSHHETRRAPAVRDGETNGTGSGILRAVNHRTQRADRRENDPPLAPLTVGDPVVDTADGRPMVVLETPELTVAEWSDREGYDLVEHDGNRRFDVKPHEEVIVAGYVSDLRSEPRTSYALPRSRLRLLSAGAAAGERVYEPIGSALHASLFDAAFLGGDDRDGAVLEAILEAAVGTDRERLANEFAAEERTDPVDE